MSDACAAISYLSLGIGFRSLRAATPEAAEISMLHEKCSPATVHMPSSQTILSDNVVTARYRGSYTVSSYGVSD